VLEKTSASLGGPETSGGAFGSRKLKSKPEVQPAQKIRAENQHTHDREDVF